MPCRDDWSESNDERCLRESNNELTARVDKLAAMLCSLCEWVDEKCCSKISNLGAATHSELPNWWVEHKKFDAQRKAKIKLKALAKLTAEEQEVLGIK